MFLHTYILTFLTQILLGVALHENSFEISFDNQPPVVTRNGSYDVLIKKDIIYAQGLTHEYWESPSSQVMNLKMDAYIPKNSADNRPAIMFIHGGGFVGGNKEHKAIVNLANYFAARGWVTFSINYRLKKDFGSVSESWMKHKHLVAPRRVNQYLAIYPALRDSKAALRWITKHAKEFNINPNFITIGGGSAGAVTAIGVGCSLKNDFSTEISLKHDKTLQSTNQQQEYKVASILDFWGSYAALKALKVIDNQERIDPSDPPLFIAHGTKDPTVIFEEAEILKTHYESNNLPITFYPLIDKLHGPWGAKVDNKPLSKLAFDFMVEYQNLNVN